MNSVCRRWCIPPTLLRDPADKLEGDSILAESPRPAFDRARRAVLRFAPAELFEQVALRLAAPWGAEQVPPLDRAS